MHVFAFLDLGHAPTAWAVMRGMLVSAKLNPDCSPGCISWMLAGIINAEQNGRLFNELIIEEARQIHYPKQVSRLGGMYFFEERLNAIRAAHEWGGHFEERNLFELDFFPHGQVSRLDSDWISYADTDLSGRVNPLAVDWIDSYWQGEARSANPNWELVGEGVAVVLDMTARQQAYEFVHQEFPDCWIAIEMARIACEADASPAGLITPWLTQAPKDHADLFWYLRDAEYHNLHLIEAMSKHPNFGRLAERWQKEKSIALPGFEPWMKNFRFEWRRLPNMDTVVASIHHAG